MNKIIKIFLVFFISFLYLFSAYNKITNFSTVADGLRNKIASSPLFNWINYDITNLALLFAIFLLIAGPAMMLIGVINDSISTHIYTKIGAWLLIIFLILATILYHPITEPSETNNLLKNLSLMGGLGFIAF